MKLNLKTNKMFQDSKKGKIIINTNTITLINMFHLLIIIMLGFL